jgi:hypothetical protein
VTERVVVDSAAVGALVDRLTRTAAELGGVAIPGIDAMPGSALGASTAPARVAAEVHRLDLALQEWVCSVRRSVHELGAADDVAAGQLGQR